MSAGGTSSIVPHEVRMRPDPQYALRQASLFFGNRDGFERAEFGATSRLKREAIPYAVVGEVETLLHDYCGITEKLSLLVSRESFAKFGEPRSSFDPDTGMTTEFVVAGDRAGDVSNPVRYPMPEESSTERCGISIVHLSKLVELKLASGMSSILRMKDLAEVQELIKIMPLSRDFADGLDPSVRDKFIELWEGAQAAERDGQE